MSIESTMAILYAQTGLAAPIVNATTVGPQAAAAMSRTLAAEMAKQEQQQVNKAEPQAEGAKVSPDAQHQNGGQMFGNRRKRRVMPSSQFPELLPACKSTVFFGLHVWCGSHISHGTHPTGVRR